MAIQSSLDPKVFKLYKLQFHVGKDIHEEDLNLALYLRLQMGVHNYGIDIKFPSSGPYQPSYNIEPHGSAEKIVTTIFGLPKDRLTLTKEGEIMETIPMILSESRVKAREVFVEKLR